jgi:hypothetical protein
MGIIYCGVCLYTNKKYIGSSKLSLQRRITYHINRQQDNEFYNDIQLYGREGWLWGVVEKDIPDDELLLRELYWVEEFGIDNLYNTRRPIKPLGETDYSLHKQKYLDRQREYLKRPEVRERRRIQRQEKYRETHPD